MTLASILPCLFKTKTHNGFVYLCKLPIPNHILFNHTIIRKFVWLHVTKAVSKPPEIVAVC